MHVNGRPVAAFDPEGLIFAAGVDSEMVKLYDLRSFDKVQCSHIFRTTVSITGSIHRGYYTVARRYEFYVRVARTISHE